MRTSLALPSFLLILQEDHGYSENGVRREELRHLFDRYENPTSQPRNSVVPYV